MKNKFYHISTYSVMRYWTILWMAVLSFSCSDFNPMDSYSRIPPDRNTDIDDGDEGDGAGGLFEKGYGTMNKPYLVMDVIQIQNMSEALVKGKMIYFQLGADIDMKSVSNWEPLNSNGDYYIYFDGNNHIIKNFTCTDKAYASFFGNSGKLLLLPYTKGFGRITHFLGNDLATVLYTAFCLDLLFKQLVGYKCTKDIGTIIQKREKASTLL